MKVNQCVQIMPVFITPHSVPPALSSFEIVP